MIEVKNIQKKFGDKVVIEDVSAQMKPGQCNLIIGASGSGKTVLMKCMVGLLTPDDGEICYQGENFFSKNQEQRTNIRKEIGMLFQGSALFDSLTVEQNIMFPLDMFTKDSDTQKLKRVNEVLARVNLQDVNRKFPAEKESGTGPRGGAKSQIPVL
jgi:phospholipid/cholesterol/gamma-HCH transport system ATP-binding protein